MPEVSKKYDLEERTAQFGELIIQFCKSLQQNDISKPLINQLLRSSTSIGANYLEANGASSKKDFRNKIYICKKESQETKHWLRMLLQCYPNQAKDIQNFSQECQELIMIFQKITSTLDKWLNENSLIIAA